MKRRLILGFSALAFILIVLGFYLFQNIHSRSESQRIKHEHQLILRNYLQIMNKLKDMQLHLYLYEFGDIAQANEVINNVRASENLLDEMLSSYDKLKNDYTCKTCHVSNPNIKNIYILFRESIEDIKDYSNSAIVGRGALSVKKAKDESMKRGAIAQAKINSFLNKMLIMDTELNKFIENTRVHQNNLVVIGVAAYIIISAIIIILIIRSITIPFKLLLEGIEKVSSGNYNSNVKVVSEDEMGFLAIAFNNLTRNLHDKIIENQLLLKDLHEINDTLEKRIAKKTEELKIAHDNMLRMESIAIAGNLAFGVAHELSTPLSTLMGYCDLINAKIPDEHGVKKFSNLLGKEVERCMDILTGMLDFAKVPDNQKQLTDINSMITDILLLVSLQKKYKNVNVNENMEPALPQIMANPSGLRQVFMNIIINALQAMPNRGELSISTSVVEQGKNIMVSISDSGHGIPANDIDKIFTSFYTTKKTGTGLGLSISHGIVKGHDGFISVKTEEGKGTTFNIFLPVLVKSKPLVK